MERDQYGSYGERGCSIHLRTEGRAQFDSTYAAIFRGSGSRNGKSLDNPTCLRMRIEDGRVVELWEFVWDLYHVDDFWS